MQGKHTSHVDTIDKELDEVEIHADGARTRAVQLADALARLSLSHHQGP